MRHVHNKKIIHFNYTHLHHYILCGIEQNKTQYNSVQLHFKSDKLTTHYKIPYVSNA